MKLQKNLLIWLSYIFLSVNCQLDFDLIPKDTVVYGVKGQDKTLQWNIVRKNGSEKLVNVKLDLLGNQVRPLYFVNIDNGDTFNAEAEKIFGAQRIASSFEDLKTFKLTLRNLDYNDTGTFQLQVSMLGIANPKTGKIKLVVQGVLNIIYFSCF